MPHDPALPPSRAALPVPVVLLGLDELTFDGESYFELAAGMNGIEARRISLAGKRVHDYDTSSITVVDPVRDLAADVLTWHDAATGE